MSMCKGDNKVLKHANVTSSPTDHIDTQPTLSMLYCTNRTLTFKHRSHSVYIFSYLPKVMFLHLSVILFTGGVCLSACWDTPTHSKEQTPQEQTPRERNPSGTDPPRSRHPPGADAPSRWLLLRTVCVLLECILVYIEIYILSPQLHQTNFFVALISYKIISMYNWE